MKRLLLVGTAFLSLAFSDPANAVPFDFTFTGNLVTFTVPTTDTYQILAFGAQGGSGALTGIVSPGGRGAKIGGDFTLTAGETLQIAVGGAGMSFDIGGAGGGGGSFVVGPGNTPLVIAGGGGGGGSMQFVPLPGQGGLTGPDGGSIGSGGGGTGGNGGAGGISTGGGAGGGGGGFLSAGGNGMFGGDNGMGGGAFPDLTGGLLGGGFGGGGGVGVDSGGGGGGGYSGGRGGNGTARALFGGGGGGSFDAGTDQILVADFQTGNGEVIITELAAAVPEPASIALLGAGLVSLMTVRRRRRSGP